MIYREIVEIDENLCNGCGDCLPNCAEGALQIVDGKAKLVKEEYCDGLGACLGHCPQDAIKIIKREAEPFSEEAVNEFLKNKEADASFSCEACHSSESETMGISEAESNLSQWPIQLNLVPTKAGFFDGKELLVVADCVPAAYPRMHGELLKNRSIVMGCPKLDNTQMYINKLSEILRSNNIPSVTVARMEVPCCGGLSYILEKAIEASGKEIPVNTKVISIQGKTI
jgi:ferredoxin